MSESDLPVIPSEKIQKTLKEFFTKKFNSNNVKITIETGTKNGDNFLGIVYRVTGEKQSESNGSQNGVENDRKLSIILKIAPTNKERREKFFSRQAFEREMFIYSEV